MRNPAKLAIFLAAALLLLPRCIAAESISKAEVLAAIQAAIQSRGHAFPAGQCQSALQMASTIPQSGAPGLVVTEIKFDSALRQATFLLRSRQNPNAPPFYAWCSYQAESLAAIQRQQVAPRLSLVNNQQSLGPVLVDVHRAAQLFLHSEHGAAVLRVKPLQCGHKGERIRVRLPLHGKMIEARVVGEDALDAAF